MTSNQRARLKRDDYPLTREGDNLFNHELQMWQYEEIDRLQKRVAELERNRDMLEADLQRFVSHVARGVHEPAAQASNQKLPSELWVVLDPSDNDSVYSAPWEEACHEHINEAIGEEIDGAGSWVVRRYVLADEPATPASNKGLAEFLRTKADGAGADDAALFGLCARVIEASAEPATPASKTLLQRLAEALHIAMKHFRHDDECGSSYYGSDGSRGCGCGKTQDRFRIEALFSDEEWKAVHAGRVPDEPPAALDEFVCMHGHRITPAGLLKIRKLQRSEPPAVLRRGDTVVNGRGRRGTVVAVDIVRVRWEGGGIGYVPPETLSTAETKSELQVEAGKCNSSPIPMGGQNFIPPAVETLEPHTTTGEDHGS